MPDWQPDWTEVSFDHAAAVEAAAACRAAARRLTELRGRRDSLAADAVVEWRGRFRGDFDRALGVHRRWTEGLVTELMSQAACIDAAAAEARRLQAARQRDRDRWHDEVRAEETAAGEPADRT